MMAAEDVIVCVRDTEERDAALGYPLIDDCGWKKPPAAVGYPLPPEKKEPRPPATKDNLAVRSVTPARCSPR
jgi:hypothetical protein